MLLSRKFRIESNLSRRENTLSAGLTRIKISQVFWSNFFFLSFFFKSKGTSTVGGSGYIAESSTEGG